MTGKPVVFALVVSIALTCGCRTSGQASVTTLLAVGAVVTGVAVATSSWAADTAHGGPSGRQLAGGFVAFHGTIGTLISLGGIFVLPAEPAPAPPPAPLPPPQATAEEVAAHASREMNERRAKVATDLTASAKTAARAGDCETVRKIDPRVRSLDATFHETTFLADVGIRRCLEPAAAPPITAPLAPPPPPP